jgi:DNA-binding response OmpR family regulator
VPAQRILIKTLLVREGFEVDVAEDGAEAVHKTARVLYDAVRAVTYDG